MRYLTRCILLLVVLNSPRAFSVPLITVPRCAQPPVIDGALDAASWAVAAGPGCFSMLNGGLASVQPEILACFDADNLYIAAHLPLPAGRAPKATAKERDGQVWADDALELFLDPIGEGGPYYQLIVNARGTRYDARGRDAGWNANWQAVAATTADGWCVEIAIPFAALGTVCPKDGTTWAANFAWDCPTGDGAVCSWAPMAGSLHAPGRFGTLRFDTTAPTIVLHGPSSDVGGVLRFDGAWGPAAQPLRAVAALLPRPGRGKRGVPTARTTASGGTVREPLKLALEAPVSQGFVTPGDYLLQVSVDVAGRKLWATEVEHTVRPALDTVVEAAWLAGKLQVSMDSSVLTEQPSVLAVDIQLVNEAGQAVRQEHRQGFDTAGKAVVTFATAGLAPGAYRLRLTAKAAESETPYVSETALRKPARPEWLGSKAGLSDEVPPPWIPVEAGPDTVSVWGRTYRFNRLPFPSSVITRDTEVLARPITLEGRVGGRAITWTPAVTGPAAATPHQATLTVTAEAAALTCRGSVTVEYDGMVRSDFTLTPTRAVTVESLFLEIPIKPEFAKYLYHWPGRWGSAYNAGALPETAFATQFKPFFWLGDEWRGLSWFAESDRGFHNADAARVIAIRREADAVVLQVNIIDTPTEIAEPVSYTFGFQATPVKPMSPDVWDYRINHGGTYGLENRPYTASATLKYSAAGSLSLAEGTFECWVRPHFDMDPDVDPKSPGRGVFNRNLLDIDLGNDCHVGFYWNIDDRSMRLYYRQGKRYPVLIGTHASWQPGDWHHVAFTWGERTIVYLDGKEAGERAHVGFVPGDLAMATITIGKQPCEMDIDEIRISARARSDFSLSKQAGVDEHTLLLDHLEESFEPNGTRKTTPAKGKGAVVRGGSFAEGKFGMGLAISRSDRQLTYLDYLSECGVRTLCFHEHWTDIQAYPKTTHGAKLRSLVAACHDSEIQLLLYHGYLLSNIAPEWETYRHDCLVHPQRGGYHREPEQWAYIVCLASPWQDFLAHYLDSQMAEFGTDGVYLDGTSEPWGCKNPHHGCGFTKPDGTIGTTYPIFATRSMMKRIYTIVRKHNPKGQVNVHQSTCMTIPTLAFATSYWDGEQFGSIARGPHALKVLSLDAFRCEFMGHNWGVPAEFLCYNRPYTQHEAMAFTLLHDVLVRGNLAEQGPLWTAMAQFGRAEADWHPYWQNAEFARTNDVDIKVSLYNRVGKGLVAVVSNLAQVKRRAEVTFDLVRLGQAPGLTGVEILSQRPVPVRDGNIAVSLAPLDYAVVWLRPR